MKIVGYEAKCFKVEVHEVGDRAYKVETTVKYPSEQFTDSREYTKLEDALEKYHDIVSKFNN